MGARGRPYPQAAVDEGISTATWAPSTVAVPVTTSLYLPHRAILEKSGWKKKETSKKKSNQPKDHFGGPDVSLQFLLAVEEDL